jgi:hypothetical protein
MAEMMQLAQEGKMRQGLGSVIGAALTGAATPHALQSGQESARAAGEAADKGVASLNAGQDMMMAKAAEMEGAPVKNYNAALGTVWGALQKDKENKANIEAAAATAQGAVNRERESNVTKERIADLDRQQKAQESLEKSGRVNKAWAGVMAQQATAATIAAEKEWNNAMADHPEGEQFDSQKYFDNYVKTMLASIPMLGEAAPEK